MPKVTVIIATRNRCTQLPRAVASARRAGTDVEIIVVDDASEDQTPEVCRGWDDVRYLRAKLRLGPGGARNVGLIAATSPYVSFLDDDDVRLPGSLDHQVALLEADPKAGMIYGRALYGDEECRPNGSFYPEQCPEGDIFRQLLCANFIPCPTVVFRRSCATRVGLLEERAPGVEDWDLWVRIAELYSVIATEQPVAVWRRPVPDSNQFTSRPAWLFGEARRLLREKWLRLPRAIEAGPSWRGQIARAFADSVSQQLVWAAAERWKAGSLVACGRMALSGLGLYPVGVTRKFLSGSTRTQLLKTIRHRQRGEPTTGFDLRP